MLIGVSYLTEPPDREQLAGLTYATVSSEDRAASRDSWNRNDVLASVAVLGAILAAYLYFSG